MNPNDASIEELRHEARQAIRNLPAGVQGQFEQLLDQQEIVGQVLANVPDEQRERIVPLFQELFTRTWQATPAPMGVGAA